MKNGRATGPDGIPAAEVWRKSLGEEGTGDMLWDPAKKIYSQEKTPKEWRESFITPIYKEKGDIQDYLYGEGSHPGLPIQRRVTSRIIYTEKGDIQDCANYRGIKLMSHTMEIWERIVDQRIREETSEGEEQFGFMPGRGMTDAVSALRQMMEKHQREEQKGLHTVFTDLEKA
ncbi:uncharacterized protein [Macrobrachium rosenbergii]|uniref:uncharacterized protein n=1 Tax=Macrobrachium rosenbergii TaxID=79674 RepID=UPI0034D5EB8D